MTDLRNQPNTASKSGSVPTKCDYSHLIWFSTLEDIDKILFFTSIFGLTAKPKISGTGVKQHEKAFPAYLWV